MIDAILTPANERLREKKLSHKNLTPMQKVRIGAKIQKQNSTVLHTKDILS